MRQDTHSSVEASLASGDKRESINACWEWASNEMRVDELRFAMGGQSVRSDDQDRVLRARLSKASQAALKKPRQLVAIMEEVESSHPWSRAFANCMLDLEERLLG